MGTPFHLQCTRTVTKSLVKSLLFVTVKFCYIVDARTIKYQENWNFGTARVSQRCQVLLFCSILYCFLMKILQDLGKYCFFSKFITITCVLHNG